MGWTNQLVNLIILAAQQAGFSGFFVYSPAPGPGNLILSVAAAPGTDPFGNPYKGPGLTTYGAAGSSLFFGVSGTQAEIFFASGAAIEQLPARIFAVIGGVSPHRFLAWDIEGPEINVSGHTDRVVLELNSANEDGTSSANGEFVYVDLAAAGHLSAFWDATGFIVRMGSITAVDPTTGTVATPAVPETWHSLGTLANFTVTKGRYRLTPEGELELDVQVTGNGANAATTTFSTAIAAAWRTATVRRATLETGRAVTAGDAWPTLQVNTDGTVDVKTVANITVTLEANVSFPTD